MEEDYVNSLDLLVLILKKLPVKTLLRFKCVCKWWKQVIESTTFTLEHLAVQSPHFIEQNSWENNLDLLDPQALPSISNIVTITGTERNKVIFGTSVHGVICYLDRKAKSVIVWNPSTHKRLEFPLPVWICFPLGVAYCGFWIDPLTKDFKVVLFMIGEGENVSLYSSTTAAWTKICMDAMIAEECRTDLENRQVMVDDVAYWTASSAYCEGSPLVILFFDFREEKLGTLELEALTQGGGCITRVCKWRGLLSVAHWNNKNNMYQLWVMQKNGSWSKKFSSPFPRSLNNIFWVLDCGRVLACAATRCNAAARSNAPRGNHLLLFHPNGTLITLHPRYYNRVIVAFEHVESFIFPDPTI